MRTVDLIHRKRVRVRAISDLSLLPQATSDAIRAAEDATTAFLATLPDSVVASAVVEFGTPLSANEFLYVD